MHDPARVSSPRQCLARALLVPVLALLVSSCGWLQDRVDENKGIQLERLTAPAGWQVSLLASGLPKARHMVMGEKGTLFVGSSDGNVYALSLDGSAVTRKRTLLRGLTDPSGVAFHAGTL
jgi:outer membrane protein assembly factor BamB